MKKAVVIWNSLIGLMLAVIVVGVITFVLWNWKIGISGHIPKEVCRQSVEVAAISNLRGIDLSADVNCPTQYEEIKTKDKETIKKKLANNMRDCWWQFGEGQKELFGSPKIYCVVCSVTSFESEDQKIRGFSKYLMENDAPGKDISYMDYFHGFKTNEVEKLLGKIDPETLANLENEELDTSKKYAVMFLYAKGKDNIKIIAKHFFMQTPEGKAGGITAGIFGAGAGIITGVGVVGASFVASNPVGWAVGIGVAAATITFVVVDTIFLRFSSDNAPEWAAFTVFREYTSEDIQELGCMELPAKQK